MPVEQDTEYYTWRAQTQPYAIRLHANAINRINTEVMRGFAVTRRRGTEPGGLLLGHFGDGPEIVTTIDEIEVVPCEYSQGPSYILSANDLLQLRRAMESTRSKEKYVVGYWRGHTRDGLGLSQYDADLFRDYFPDPRACALLVKPFVTRDSTARFFLQDAAGIQTTGTPPEFPLITPGRTETNAPIPQPEPVPASPPPQRVATPEPVPLPEEKPAPVTEPEIAPVPEPIPISPPRQETRRMVALPFDERPVLSAYQPGEPSSVKRIALFVSFALAAMLFGAVTGYQYAGGTISFAPGREVQAKSGKNPFDLHLTVSSGGENVQLTWDRTAPAVAAAVRGMLTITESGATKNVPLEAADLQAGTIVYHRIGSPVQFRLEFILSENASVVQTIEWSAGTPGNRLP